MSEDAASAPPPAPAATERRHLVLGMGWLTALILFCAYGFTLAPTITAGDAGELITAAWELGVPHAPGYPLYTLVGYLVTHLPAGPDPAFRMNALSMFCGVGACMVVYGLLVRRAIHPIFAGFVALGLGAGPTYWAQSVEAEVYGLNLLVLACFWYWLDTDLRESKLRPLTWAIGGLALTTHQTSILALAPALILTASTWPRATRRLRVRQALLAAGLPCLLYFQTFLSAQRPDVLAWGHPNTLSAWLQFTLLPVSQQVSAGSPLLHVNYLLELLFGEVWHQILGITGHPSEMGLPVVLALTGLWVVLSGQSGDVSQRIWGWASLLYPGVLLLFTHPGISSLAKLDPYYLPVWLSLWLLVPTGYQALLESQSASPHRKHLGPLLKPVLELVLVLGILITGGQSAVANNRAGDTLVRDSYTTLLTAAPQNTLLLCDMDDLFVLWYLQRVEGLRPDVIPVLAYFPTTPRDEYWAGWIFRDLATRYPDLAVPPDSGAALPERLKAYIATHLPERPILSTFYDPGYLEPLYPPFDFRALGVGWLPQPLAWRAVDQQAELSVTTLRSVGKFYLRGESGMAEYERWQQRYGQDYEQAYLLARYLTGIVSTARIMNQLDELELALDLYERAIALGPMMFEHYPPAVLIAEQLGELSRAVRWQSRFVQLLEAESMGGFAESTLLSIWVQEATTLARLLAASGDVPAAQQLLSEILRTAPDAAAARLLQQDLHARTGGVP